MRFWAACLLLGCASEQTVVETAAEQENAVDPLDVIDDKSRCDYKGRTDRTVLESRGPGATHHNVRRVFRIVGFGDEQRRVIVCREVDTNLDGIKDVVRRYDDDGAPLEELADANYDGRLDTWITYAVGKVAKLELDTNGDEKPDETRLYVRGKLSRVQRDTNGDGKPDVWEIYGKDRLERLGVDLDHDGRVDRWDRDETALPSAKPQEKPQPETAAAKEGTDGAAAADEKQDGQASPKDGAK